MLFFFFLFLFVEVGDFVDTVASVVLAAVITLVVVVLVVGEMLFLFWEFFGEFFPFPFLITWVHPSSSFLLGWSLIFLIVGTAVVSVAVVVVVMAGKVVVAVVVVVIVMVVVVFWGQVLEKCLSFLQDQHNGFLPSTTTIIDWSRYFMMWGMLLNPPLLRHMMKT